MKLFSLLEQTKYDEHKGSFWKYSENSYCLIYDTLFVVNDDVEFDDKYTKDGKI